MSNHDYTDIVSTRGVTVNVFKDDAEHDIALRLIRAVVDGYFEDATDLSSEQKASKRASPNNHQRGKV